MASGSFASKRENENDPYLYCEWESVPNYDKNTSDITMSVYLRYTPPLELEAGEVTLDVLWVEDLSRTFETLPISDTGTGRTKTRFLGRETWKGYSHTLNGERAVALRAGWCPASAASGSGFTYSVTKVVQLDTIPQIPPVLERREVKNVGQTSATLSMRASHSLGIRAYTLWVNDTIQTAKDGEAVFGGLSPNTQYVARFCATANNGLSTRVATEIFTTEPVYVTSIVPVDPDGGALEEIHLNEGEQISLGERLQVLPEDASEKKLWYTSSNPEVAAVFSDGTVRGISKGTCRIEICAADGGGAAARVSIQVERPVQSIYIANPMLELPVNSTCRINCFVYPETASDKVLRFASDDTAVATVTKEGIVTAVRPGTANITIEADGMPENDFAYTCAVLVRAEENLPWQDMSPLPQGSRWDYQIPAAVQSNLQYIWDKLAGTYGYTEIAPLEEIDFSNGFGTDIREIRDMLNALERNIDSIAQGIDWISPHYGTHREYCEATPTREEINRWIRFCGDLKQVIDGEKGKLRLLCLAGNPLTIQGEGKILQYICIREENLKNGHDDV